MFSTNFKKICCIFVKIKILEKSKMAANMVDMCNNWCQTWMFYVKLFGKSGGGGLLIVSTHRDFF